MNDRRERPDISPSRWPATATGASRTFLGGDPHRTDPDVPAQPEFVKDRRDPVARAALLERFRSEFRALPGLWVTRSDAARLFAVPEDICERVLNRLVTEGLLIRTADGIYHTPYRVASGRR
jgi:hypothetical protein